MYFVASNENYEIVIDKSVKNSNIGVASDNSPTVKLFKSDYPLSFLSNKNEKAGIVNIDVVSDDKKITQINMNNVDIYNSDFLISISPTIEIISFKTLSTFDKSSFSIHQNLNRNINSITLKVENVNIDSNSETIIENAELSGTLTIYDDSNLIVKENLQFSKNSKINLFIKNSKSYVFDEKTPIISLKGNLETKPKSVTISKANGINSFDVLNLLIIAAKSFINISEEWNNVFKLEDGSGEISTVCKEKDGSYFLLLNIKNKNENKGGNGLGAGAIIGIVIAIIIFAGLVIGVVIYFVKKKQIKENSPLETSLLLNL